MEYENTSPAPRDEWGALPDIPKPEPLKPGEYCYRVTKLTKGRWAEGTKVAGIARADLDLRVWNAEGAAGECRATLTLSRDFAWKAREFWKSAGENVVDGQDFIPDWDSAVGRVGRCRVSLREYVSRKDGQKHSVPDVDAWLAPGGELPPEPGSEYQQAIDEGDVPF